ncbi:hypothetical protein AA310_06875 [Arthrobacter sp. YC-RL1]|uniref:hypothetical protein n=1 Tax=Arthrobacter sp. YC-RL1 TaxID=1652545 RepID=UPI00063DB23C|nr:hypothetical protein [Arthrobacter sp. YC-RL1]ALQ31038.1 hypothetical protein ATC04_11020 [Arthrobacter sp. YC-RL1]KLI87691.1 hypothetical protein AA310_06875 [Arthrobacter sp. YC-RL1]
MGAASDVLANHLVRYAQGSTVLPPGAFCHSRDQIRSKKFTYPLETKGLAVFQLRAFLHTSKVIYIGEIGSHPGTLYCKELKIMHDVEAGRQAGLDAIRTVLTKTSNWPLQGVGLPRLGKNDGGSLGTIVWLFQDSRICMYRM